MVTNSEGTLTYTYAAVVQLGWNTVIMLTGAISGRYCSQRM